jgi:hypothetical protein
LRLIHILVSHRGEIRIPYVDELSHRKFRCKDTKNILNGQTFYQNNQILFDFAVKWFVSFQNSGGKWPVIDQHQ